MGESTSQIERDIAAERNELGRNLQLLENKARSLTDWRTHFRNHPLAMIGIAIGGGVLLGAVTSGIGAGAFTSASTDDDLSERFEAPEPRYHHQPSALSASASKLKSQFGDTWDRIADALLAVASAKAIEFVGEKVPGFREQFSVKNPDRGGYSSGRGV